MKMRKLYTLAALAALPIALFGRPASPEPIKHTNPDGTVVEYRINGDENFHYYTTADGKQLLEFDGANLRPAMRDGDILPLNNASISRLRSEIKDFPKMESATHGKVNRMAALDGNGRSVYPTIGKVRACVILVEYPDFPFTMDDPQAFYTRYCNEKGFSDFNSKGSAKDYYEACSGGKFSPTFDVYGPVKLEHEAKWYVGADDPTLPGYLHTARFGVAIKEALEALDPTVDFSVYDYDNDGLIDNIFFFYSGRGQADCAQFDKELAPYTVWPHQSDFRRYTNLYPGTLGLDPITVDGKTMATYACSCELNSSSSVPSHPWVDGIGAFCHEFGHVLGLPDLYNVVNSNDYNTPKTYSVMDTGSYNLMSTCPPLFSAYEKWLCNWLEYTDAADGTSYTLNPLMNEDANAVRIRIKRPGTNRNYAEYYVLECRDNTGWDVSLPSKGMLIWRINYSTPGLWPSNNVNVGPYNIQLVAPSNSTSYKAWPGEDMLYTYITPTTAQLSPSVLNKPLSVTLTNIAFNYDEPEGSVVTFDYNKYPEHSATTLLHSNVSANHEKRQLTFTWDAAEGATDYQLTLNRRDSSGRLITVGNLNDASVGNVTSYTTDANISAMQWNQTFSAFLRVVIGLPSSATSNTITFIPAELTDDSGVDEIGGEAISIYGGKGEIIAPEGARAYNLGGVETGLHDLPAGVYIVVTPKATAKVTVR